MKSTLVKADGKTKLKDIDTRAKSVDDKEEGQALSALLRVRLRDLQERLYAENKRSLLLVFQAMDTGGKDGAIRKLLTGIDPAGVRVTSFKAPSVEELSHDFLWRVHQHAPADGMIGVWNRSHYEDVLIVRVHKMIEQAKWEQRYQNINNFEKMLVDNDTKIVKFFLMISKDEQKERLQDRLDEPDKNWKFNPGDLAERKLWDDYLEAYQDMVRTCSTEIAPWYIVPSDRKWARSLAIAQKVVEVLEEMNPQPPKVDFDPAKIIIK